MQIFHRIRFGLAVAAMFSLVGCQNHKDAEAVQESSEPPTPAPTATISSSVTTLTLGQTVTLKWESTDATSCSATGAWNGIKAASGSEAVIPSMPGDLVFGVKCIGKGGDFSVETPIKVQTEVSSKLVALSTIDATDVPYGAIINAGDVPRNGTAAPLSVTTSIDTVRGGSVIISIDAPKRLSSLLVSIDSSSGTPSYYGIDLTKPTALSETTADGTIERTDPNSKLTVVTSPSRDEALREAKAAAAVNGPTKYDLIITVGQNLIESKLPLLIVGVYDDSASTAQSDSTKARSASSAHSQESAKPAAATPANTSPPAKSAISINAAAQASDKLQVTLNWTANVDIDLEVTTPNNNIISYRNRQADGGTLDVDAYASCHPPVSHTENVTWAAGAAPTHVYKIRPAYYDSCDVASSVRYVLTINNAGLSRARAGTFEKSEANGGSSTNATKIAYTAVLSPEGTDEGLVSRLLLAEIRNPSAATYSASDSEIGMRAIRSIVENRKKKPSIFNASSSSTSAIITARGQFAGFDGGISEVIRQRTNALVNPAGNSSKFVDFWNDVFRISEAASVIDPYASVTVVAGVNVEPGTYGVRTAGSSEPGGSFVALSTGKNIAGQDFYTLKKGTL